MNTNLEPGFLIIDFCRDTNRINARGTATFDDETDLEPFLAWIAAEPHRARTWADLRHHLECDDADLIGMALGEPQFGWQPVKEIDRTPKASRTGTPTP